MKQNNNGTTAAKVNNETMNGVNNRIDAEREAVGRLERCLAMGETIDRDECEQVAAYHQKYGGHTPAEVVECLHQGWQFTENRREVTNPIKADDLHTPRVYQLSERRYIVKHCTREQAAELERLGGRYTIEGVIFRASKANRDRLHIWQNRESRKERAAILGEGWQYVEGLNHGTQPGDLITCLDGTQGRVTKSSPESCCIEFETADGQRLSVAGYFRYTPSAKSETADDEEDPTLTEAEKRDTLCRLWDAAWQQARQDPETYRVIVETNEEDPSANCNPFGRYYMVDFWPEDGLWHVIRVDIVTSPYEVHRPNWAGTHGYRDDETQLACRCENPNNVTRWARKMIGAGRVTDIYADCY